MKTELFLMRALFVLVAFASVAAMGGMLHSEVAPAQKLVQTAPASATAG